MFDRYALLQPPPDNHVVEPASIAQVRASRSGKMVLIDDDVGGVALGLRNIERRMRLRFSDVGKYFVVYYEHDAEGCVDCAFPDTCEPYRAELILTAQECDQRIVKRVELIDQHGRGGYDLVKELERQDAERAKRTRGLSEKHKSDLERRLFELRKSAGQASKIVVPS